MLDLTFNPKIFSIDKRTIEVVNCKNDKLSHKHLIHINKFVRKDSNVLNNLILERVEWESNDVFCEGGVSVCF